MGSFLSVDNPAGSVVLNQLCGVCLGTESCLSPVLVLPAHIVCCLGVQDTGLLSVHMETGVCGAIPAREQGVACAEVKTTSQTYFCSILLCFSSEVSSLSWYLFHRKIHSYFTSVLRTLRSSWKRRKFGQLQMDFFNSLSPHPWIQAIFFWDFPLANSFGQVLQAGFQLVRLYPMCVGAAKPGSQAKPRLLVLLDRIPALSIPMGTTSCVQKWGKRKLCTCPSVLYKRKTLACAAHGWTFGLSIKGASCSAPLF